MYRTRKNNGVVWDDDVHSLRGLEELLTKPGVKTKSSRRVEHRNAVLLEQERLRDPVTKREVEAASIAMRRPEKDLPAELLRGVSCSISKTDRQRALGYAQKDERFVSRGSSSTRRLLEKLKIRFNGWSNLSSRSLHSSDREGQGSDADE